MSAVYSGLRAHSAAQTGHDPYERLIHLGAVTKGVFYPVMVVGTQLQKAKSMDEHMVLTMNGEPRLPL